MSDYINYAVAAFAIAHFQEECDDAEDVIRKELTEDDFLLLAEYEDTQEFTNKDVLMAAIAVVKAKINELKETKE